MLVTSYLNGMAGLLFKKTGFTAPTTYYFGISTQAITADGIGIQEPDSSSGYARVAIPVNNTNWTDPVNGMCSNVNTISMPPIKVDSGIGKYWFLSESATGNNCVIFDKFDKDRPLAADSNVYINAGELKIGVKNPVIA